MIWRLPNRQGGLHAALRQLVRGGARSQAQQRPHDLIEILFIAFVATLCGCKTCVEIVEFAEVKKAFFAKILTLKHGVPSHDTFSTVSRILDPKRSTRPSASSWPSSERRLPTEASSPSMPALAKAGMTEEFMAAIVSISSDFAEEHARLKQRQLGKLGAHRGGHVVLGDRLGGSEIGWGVFRLEIAPALERAARLRPRRHQRRVKHNAAKRAALRVGKFAQFSNLLRARTEPLMAQ